MLNSLSAARYLVKKTDDSITNLKLQKILYISYMLCMGKSGVPLIEGNFEAWDLGPVHPEVYHTAKIFGNSQVNHSIFKSSPENKQELLKYIDDAVDHLKNFTAAQLVNITHQDDGAWAKHYKSGVRGIIIPGKDIMQEYHDRTKQ